MPSRKPLSRGKVKSVKRDVITSYELDGAGRITVQRQWESDKAAAVETRKTRYNAFGEISAKGIGDGWEEFAEYSTLGKVIKTNAGDGAIKFYVYDANGNQTREIRGNGDASVDIRTMSLVDASISNKLFSRISVYNSRNLLTQTIDPKIDYLASTSKLSELYQTAWVPAWTAPGVRPDSSRFVPDGSPLSVSGTPPRVYVYPPGSPNYGFLYVGLFDSAAAAKSANVGGGAAAALGAVPLAWDVTSLKGQGTKYFRYAIWRDFDGDEIAQCVGQISVSANGEIDFRPYAPEVGVIRRTRSRIIIETPDLTRWDDQTAFNYQIIGESGQVLLSGREYGNANSPVSIYTDAIRPPLGTPARRFTLKFEGYIHGPTTVVGYKPTKAQARRSLIEVAFNISPTARRFAGGLSALRRRPPSAPRCPAPPRPAAS